jgi:hypothetical protein
MKKLITILVASFCLFIGTASAEKPGWAGKGKHDKETRQMQKELRKEQYQRDKELRKEQHKRDDHEKGKHDEVRERLREKKDASERKELEHLSDEAQEKRRKWWKFWE